ncbi:MAG: hypothetical protein AB7K04_00150 [Pseudorhodoplanes sp.]
MIDFRHNAPDGFPAEMCRFVAGGAGTGSNFVGDAIGHVGDRICDKVADLVGNLLALALGQSVEAVEPFFEIVHQLANLAFQLGYGDRALTISIFTLTRHFEYLPIAA